MTASDFSEFGTEVRRLATVFRLKASPAELGQIIDAYFHALQRFSVTQIVNATDAWIAKETKFPKPAELAAIAPRRATPMTALAGDALEDWLRAERLRWEDEPCRCAACVAADVTEKPLRFVPEFDADDRDLRVMVNGRIVTAGHWAHGTELARWYKARADFYNRCLELGLRGNVLQPAAKRKKSSFKERMDKIFWKAQNAPEPEV